MIINTTVNSIPFEICSVKQASEDLNIQYNYLYVLIELDKIDITYPFPIGESSNSGPKFVVKNEKYNTIKERYKEGDIKL